MTSTSFFLLLLPLLLLLQTLFSSSNAHSTATSFLDHFTEAPKIGDRHPAIAGVKTYLRRYGYLSVDDIDDDHYFDVLLESALKTYQSNFKLDPTGRLDAPTAAMMRTPRCGVPDVLNGTNWMAAPARVTHHHHSRFRTTARYNFFPGNPTWPEGKRNLTYGFLPGTPEMARKPVARAFKKWGAHSHGRFAFVATTEDQAGSADIKIGFFSGFHGDTGSFDGPGGSLAHSSPPESGLLHFDSEETWAVGSVQKAFDVETVALHEIGHILGLMHSSVPTAIMYPAVGDGVTKKLSRDDVHGFRALYKV
ncbi:unnamed protein product [Linum trigynum]|uniref:Peptidase metallopeptidase domain-containing protein n=1 Tax=Linum trigynum TaxID=586398 RepID=A0AAV2CPD2_9ROSI